MDILELYIDEEMDKDNVFAISVVENPAIEEDWIALKSQTIELAEVDKDKHILMGAALIPNLNILRKDKEGKDYYVFFSEETVKKASELFLIRGMQNNSTLEHEFKLKGLRVVESWIEEDEKMDKSAKYNLGLSVGTWAVCVKVDNDDIWDNYVKTGKIKGFSIEGHFSNRVSSGNSAEEQESLNTIKQLTKILEDEQK
jgi:hypothetical protein